MLGEGSITRWFVDVVVVVGGGGGDGVVVVAAAAVIGWQITFDSLLRLLKTW